MNVCPSIASSGRSSARNWANLAACADRHILDDEVPADAGRNDSASIPNPSSSAKAHHDQAGLGPVAQRDAGFLRHRQLRHRLRARPTRAAYGAFSRKNWAFPAISRLRASPAQNRQCRDPAKLIRKSPPRWFCSVQFNRRMYSAEAGRALRLHPGVVPRAPSSAAPPARRSWAMRRGPTSSGILQRAVRCAVQHSAARHGPRQSVEATPAACSPRCGWGRRGGRLLDRFIEAQPFLVRISAAKRLRDSAEQARSAPADKVSARHVAGARKSIMEVP